MLLVAGQEQWSSSHSGLQVALVALGRRAPISKTLTPFLILLESLWEVPSVVLAWRPEVALER